jgi:hypothetical protein
VSKTIRSTAVAALLLLSTAGLAGAQSVTGNRITCDGGRCEGTEERDTIVASDKAEEVVAKGGDDDIELDVVFPVGSDDVAFGGPGRDCIDGGGGQDLMVGGPGDDNRPCEFTAFVNPRAAMTGGPGDDVLDGGPGDDSLDGIADDDTLIGGEGRDLIEDLSPSDSDRLFGDGGDDELNATDGDGGDVVDGGPGRDRCSGDVRDTFRNCEIGRTGPSSDEDDDAFSRTDAPSEPGSDPPSFVALFGSARTTTALRGGLVTVPGVAVRCGVGPCQVSKRLFTARRAGVLPPADGKRRGLVGRDRDDLAAGQTGQVRLRLSRSAERTLRRRGRMRLEVLVTITDARGRSERARRTFTVKRPS